MKFLLVLFCLAACADKVPAKDSPPIAEGKCAVNKFAGTLATAQICIWKGYTYECNYTTSYNECVNKGEAVGERPR